MRPEPRLCFPICSFGAMVYSPRTGILLNNELLDLCWRRLTGSSITPRPGECGDPVGERREGRSCPPRPATVNGDGGVGGVEAVLEGTGLEARMRMTVVWPPVAGERPPSSMVPSILVNAAQGSKLVIGGAGGELIISAVVQVSLGAPGWHVPSLGGPVVLLSHGGREGSVWGAGAASLPHCGLLLSTRPS